MGRDDDIGKLGKQWVYYVEIEPRVCSLTNGESPCAATEQCTNAWAGCKDRDAFDLTTKVFKFSSKNGPQVLKGEQILPLLVDVGELATEIDPKRSKTISARVDLVFEDLADPPPFFPEKGAGKYFEYRQGTFWSIFRQIFEESYKYCNLKLYEGLPSYTSLSDFGLRRELKVNNIEKMSDGKWKVTATDKMRPLKNVKIPNSISSSNVTTATVAVGASTVPITDGAEFKILGSGYPSHAKIIDDTAGDEYIKFTGVSTNNLTGVTRGMFGTSDVEHAAGVQVIQIAPFASESDVGASTDPGMNLIDVLGRIFLGWMEYSLADFDVNAFIDEVDIWYSGRQFHRIIESPITADKLVSQLTLLTMSNIWQDNSQMLTFKGLHPIPPSETPTELTDDANIVKDSTRINYKTETQISRVIVHFAPNDIWGTKDHTSKDEFSQTLTWINSAAENANGQGDIVDIEFFADWIYKVSEAKAFAARYARRYSPVAPAEMEFQVTRRDSDVETGDIIDITSDEFVEDDGSSATVNFQVLAKSETQEGLIRLKALETKFAEKYAWICPSGYPDWTSATDFQKLYGYICDSATLKMSDGAVPSRVY